MPQVLPDLPYRGMKSFRLIDRNIYAGRDTEIQKISKLLLLYRGLLIYGDSGVGKSSLMNAGVFPTLLEDDFQPEVVRLNPDLNGTFVVSKIRCEKDKWQPSIFDQFRETDATDSKKINVSFREFKETIRLLDLRNRTDENACKLLPKVDRSVVLIFDQFEELITLFEEDTRFPAAMAKRRQMQGLIVQLLTRCYFSQTLPVKLVFVFREDYLAKFARLFKSIPDLRDHYLRIKPLTTDQINSIIYRPFDDTEKQQHFSNPFSAELCKNISQKMTLQYPDGNIDLTEMQIVCLQLYNIPGNEQRTAALQQHSVGDILQNFYLELLNSINEKDRPVAIDILSLLVLNERTRNIFHKDAIIHHLRQYTPEAVQAAIDKLEYSIKVIRREVRQGGIYYEIVSEAMIPYINRKKQEKERAEEQLAVAAAEAQETKRRLKIRRIVMGMSFILLLMACYAVFYYHTAKVEKRRQNIASTEKEWFQKIPRQDLRDRITDTLMRLGKDSTDYKAFRNAFAISADTYDYIKKSEYSTAIAAASLGYLFNKNSITRQILDSQLSRTLLPAQYITPPTGLPNRINRLIAAQNGMYFIIHNNGLVEAMNYRQPGKSTSINTFLLPASLVAATAALPGNTVRQPQLPVPSLAAVPGNNAPCKYILYKNDTLCLLSDAGAPLTTKAISFSIVLVCGFAPNQVMAVSASGKAQLYDVSNNTFTPMQSMQLADTRPGSFFPRLLSNNNYFCSGQTLYYVTPAGQVITKQIDTTETLLDVNRKNVLLLEDKDKNKIRYERNVTELPGFPNASMALDTNLVVNCYFDKAYLTRISTLANNIEQTKNVISDLADNFIPILSPQGNYILFRNYPDMYTIYYTATGEKKYLLVNAATTGATSSVSPSRFYAATPLFLSDSIVAIYNAFGIKLYNLSKKSPAPVLSNEPEWLATTSLPLYQKYLENDGSGNSSLKQLFPVQYLEQEIPKAYNNRQYDTAIKLTHQLLAMTKQPAQKINCYQYLYNAYYNRMLDLDATPANMATQLDYTRKMALYADSLLRISNNPAAYNNLKAKTLGSLSWYLLLNHLYTNSLDTARIALQIDQPTQKQQWINTNLALGLVFTNNLPEALKVYGHWKNRNFNDDMSPGKVRFKEDLQTLETNYGMTIPNKAAIEQALGD
ncbi:ATP-binding protein [Deminuibacter soli]|uniref:ATP-binding protein n=1 Tax=Deminuibacter soli TaxID=2291815 RepID=A0A3E1NHS3_9BACT|nr:ATP-binding protein [Deminuibacter soli]RFM27432.1 ATP-binding protein [Deminuibacter soli]